MGDNTDVLAVTDHFLEIILNALLAQVVGPLLDGLAESLLLAGIPGDGRDGCQQRTKRANLFHTERR